jgi:AcrR family transcriptional regulator
VLDAAAAVFARLGYEGSSIDDIADELGATKGRVYHYYRSKADLLLGVLTEGTQNLIDIVAPIAADPSLPVHTRLLRMSHAHAMVMMNEHSYQKVSLQSFDQLFANTRQAQWQSIIALRGEYESLFVDIVEQGLAAGVFATDDTRVAVRSLLGSLNWITVWYRPDAAPHRLTREQIADTAATFALAGVQPLNRSNARRRGAQR